MPHESQRLFELRQRLWDQLAASIPGIKLNGPAWSTVTDDLGIHPARLPGNLNVCLPRVEGQSLMLKVPQLAISSGSACTSAAPHPSHVLLGIGLTEDEARTSLRFGIGRFNTREEIDRAAAWIAQAYDQLVPLVA
jgi:cysteine desulfurase